jgi:geranylgeranyl diphosphate synthase type II
MNLKRYLSQRAALVEKALRNLLPKDAKVISQAMRYSMFAGGKRLRPILVMEAAELCGGESSKVMPAACALELIHTYSLIHDDLPAMDNDDLRRGKPTNHKKYGEATAILAGDALLTEAFRLVTLCVNNRSIDAARVVAATRHLSIAAGFQGMIGGQMKDTIESNHWEKKSKKAASKDLEYIHLNKTAALIQSSLVVGAELAGGGRQQIQALDTYGKCIGLAFQIADDILDIVGDKKLLGKRGSDKDNNKLTYPALYGIEASRRMSESLIAKAKKQLELFGAIGEALSLLANYIIERQY